MRALILAAATLLAGCTTLSPEAETVRLTKNANDVRGCESLGVVDSKPPYVLPGDYKKQLQNRAGALGADVVLITSTATGSGTAYRCGKR